MCAFTLSLNSAAVSVRAARDLYRRFQYGGDRMALVQSMRKVNSAIRELRMAGYNLSDMRHCGAISSTCARVYHYTLAARERELYELYDLVSVQLEPTEWLKMAR